MNRDTEDEWRTGTAGRDQEETTRQLHKALHISEGKSYKLLGGLTKVIQTKGDILTPLTVIKCMVATRQTNPNLLI